MAKFPLLFDAENKVLTLGAETDEPAEGTSIGFITAYEVGDVPPSNPSPQPEQFIRNLMMARNVIFEELTIKNETGNKRFDHLVQQGKQEPTEIDSRQMLDAEGGLLFDAGKANEVDPNTQNPEASDQDVQRLNELNDAETNAQTTNTGRKSRKKENATAD